MANENEHFLTAVERLIAEVRQMLANTEYEDGAALGLTHDHEAVEIALDHVIKLLGVKS